MHGKGVYHYSSVNVYEGDFQIGMKCGHGAAKWSSGASYDGQWKDNKMHGRGVYHFPDDHLYEGDFENGVRSGHGIQKRPDGASYDGQWKEN